MADVARRVVAAVLVTDLDRTFAGPGLRLDSRAVAAMRAAGERGLVRILATGRRRGALAHRPTLVRCFDHFILEEGAVWGQWDDLRIADADVDNLWSLARDLRRAGYAVRRGLSSISVPRTAEPGVRAHRLAERMSIHPNRDRLDIVPAGIDKGTGLGHLIKDEGLSRPVVAVGDGENDVPLLMMADHAVAVGNAVAALKAVADEVAPVGEAAAVTWFLEERLAAAAGAD